VYCVPVLLMHVPKLVREDVDQGLSARTQNEILFDRYNIVNERDKQDALRRTHDYFGCNCLGGC
jgi:hypothetical protein